MLSRSPHGENSRRARQHLLCRFRCKGFLGATQGGDAPEVCKRLRLHRLRVCQALLALSTLILN